MENYRYDPPIARPGNSSEPPAQSGGNSRIDRLKGEVADAQDVMRKNIDLVQERDENLQSLQSKTDDLAVSAQGFRKGASKVRKNMWWKDMKMRICIGVAIVIILIIIIVPIVKTTTN